jgi:hypothetical protein
MDALSLRRVICHMPVMFPLFLAQNIKTARITPTKSSVTNVSNPYHGSIDSKHHARRWEKLWGRQRFYHHE